MRYVVALTVCLSPASVFAQDRPVRDVTPPGVNRIYQPLAPAASPQPAVPTEKFTDAKLLNDGSIAADGKVLKLKGIAFPARNQVCGQPGVVRWACGVRAYGFARLALEHKTLECDKVGLETSPAAVTCWIDRKDFALLLLESGWVNLAPGEEQKAYVAAAAAARNNKAGLWADSPPDQKEKPKRPLAIP